MANETRVMTGKVRLSFVHLFKPYAAEKGQEEKYSCTILVPKTDVQTKAKSQTTTSSGGLLYA